MKDNEFTPDEDNDIIEGQTSIDDLNNVEDNSENVDNNSDDMSNVNVDTNDEDLDTDSEDNENADDEESAIQPKGKVSRKKQDPSFTSLLGDNDGKGIVTKSVEQVIHESMMP